jgi:hypothetical protein
LNYELQKAVDLRDESPPPDWAFINSTHYPRENPPLGYWGFDYEALFTADFAAQIGIEDPDEEGRFLTLCELSERGLVHEVWIYASGDVPDAGAAEVLGIMPRYDEEAEEPLSAVLDRCAGNGCFDEEDEIPLACDQTLRIAFINNTRGVGCFMESLSHGFETIAGRGYLPPLAGPFREFAGFALDERFGLPFDSWYACPYDGDCLTYPTDHSVNYEVGIHSDVLDPYDPICGNAHWPPNARSHYDIRNTQPILSSCPSFRLGDGEGGKDALHALSADQWMHYDDLAPDCTGAWLVYWWQNFPGRNNAAMLDDTRPMPNWWPYFFY